MQSQSRIAELEATIAEQCENVTWVTTGIFILSIFLTILRPDPTLAICLFGFYGAHVRSFGAIRSFWFFTLISVLVDALWLLAYSPLRPIEWDTLQQLSRKDQLSVMLSVLNVVYKLIVVWSAINLQMTLTRRELLIKEMELEAGPGSSCTSSGEPIDSRSLAAQEAGR